MFNVLFVFCLCSLAFGALAILYVIYEWVLFYILNIYDTYIKKHSRHQQKTKSSKYIMGSRESRYRF